MLCALISLLTSVTSSNQFLLILVGAFVDFVTGAHVTAVSAKRRLRSDVRLEVEKLCF